MMTLQRVFGRAAFAAMLWMAGPALAEETLESVEKAIGEKAKKLKSVTFKNTFSQAFEGEGMKMSSRGESTYEMKKVGETWKYRSEGTSDSVSTFGETEHKQTTRMLMVCDGEFIYTLSESGGQKSAMKNAVADLSIVPDKAYFEMLREGNELKYLGEEKIDGRPTYFIRATVKETGPGSVSAMDYYFDRETGLVIKTVGKDADGKNVYTSECKDIKINPEISDDRFVFKAPEGVEVVDLSRQPGDFDAGRQDSEDMERSEE